MLGLFLGLQKAWTSIYEFRRKGGKDKALAGASIRRNGRLLSAKTSIKSKKEGSVGFNVRSCREREREIVI